ncbi:MAG: hypothetical protein ACFFDW_17320, partial [Candidatus Thorarchaeota archaeon]
SKPGGAINLQVIKTVNAEAAKVIGPEGGVVAVTNPESLIYGAEINIPENIMSNSILLQISILVVILSLKDLIMKK